MLEAEQDVNIWSNLVKNKKVALIGPANYLQKFSQEFKDETIRLLISRTGCSVNDDRITRVASFSTGKPISEKYPCYFFDFGG
jgi:hypothetical protein